MTQQRHSSPPLPREGEDAKSGGMCGAEGRRSINISPGGSSGVEECASGTLGTLTICEGLERFLHSRLWPRRGRPHWHGQRALCRKLSRARNGSHAAGGRWAGGWKAKASRPRECWRKLRRVFKRFSLF